MDLTPAPNDAGFTLVEAMIAGAVGLAITMPAYTMLRATYASMSTVNSRVQRNVEARQVLSLIGDGSSSSSGSTYVRGVRQEGILQTIFTSSNGLFTMTDPTMRTSLTGDKTAPISIRCAGPQLPLPTCLQAGQTVSASGWLGANPTVIAPPTGRTATVSITVSDPYAASRAGQTAASVSDTYRTQFNLNVQ